MNILFNVVSTPPVAIVVNMTNLFLFTLGIAVAILMVVFVLFLVRSLGKHLHSFQR